MAETTPKMLIVENEALEVAFLTYYLDQAKIPYVIAKSAAEAINCLQNDPSIAFVSLDGNLDGLSRGEEVAAYIVQKMWKPKEGLTFPRFVTTSSNPYPAPGAMASFYKRDFSDVLGAPHGIEKIQHLFGLWDKAQKGEKGTDPMAIRPPSWRALPALVKRSLSA